MGLSGSGKSSVSRFLADEFGAAWICSDIERQRNYGTQDDLYSPAVTQELFGNMASLAYELLQANYPVIIDSCALKQEERKRFHQAGTDNDCPVLLLYCQAPVKILKQRISGRLRAGKDPSEAQPELIDRQKQWLELPSFEEQRCLINIDTCLDDWQTALKNQLANWL